MHANNIFQCFNQFINEIQMFLLTETILNGLKIDFTCEFICLTKEIFFHCWKLFRYKHFAPST